METRPEDDAVVVEGCGSGRRQRWRRPRAPGAPYSLEQAAAALNLSPRTVRQRIRAGWLVAYRDGRLWRIPERAVADYLASREGDRSLPIGTGTAVRRHLKS